MVYSPAFLGYDIVYTFMLLLALGKDMLLHPEDGGSIFLRNVCVYVQEHMVSRPTRPQSEPSPLWKPHAALGLVVWSLFQFCMDDSVFEPWLRVRVSLNFCISG
jgi:hypothetical protein